MAWLKTPSPSKELAGPVYRIENVTKRYGRGKAALATPPANININLQIDPGEIFGLLGSNGAGKSTMIRQMVNLVSPSEGRISLFGHDIARNAWAVARYVAYMPQKPSALLDLTAREAIYFTGHLRGMNRYDAGKAADRLVDEWGLQDIRDRQVRKLSGGQHRLVGLALSLIGDLPVLILDEPTNELDPAYRKQVWDFLKELNTRQKTTIILVTHNVVEAEQVIGRVAIMSRGEIVGLGRVGELKEKIDRSVRLELFVKPERTEQLATVLNNFENVQRLNPVHYNLLVPRENAEDGIHRVLSSVRLENLEDFQVHTATLEDVYMAYTGREIGEDEVKTDK